MAILHSYVVTGPTWQKEAQPSIVDPFAAYLRQRVAQGCRNATQLWREIREHGFPGQVVVVRCWVRRLRDGHPDPSPRPRTLPWRPPASRQTTRLLLAEAVSSAPERQFLSVLRDLSPEVAQAADLARAFVTLIKGRDLALFEGWIAAAKTGPLSGFAEGLSRDREAVQAALRLPWSTGPVEGQINRLKMLKRGMYGRAKLDLLRQRVLHPA